MGPIYHSLPSSLCGKVPDDSAVGSRSSRCHVPQPKAFSSPNPMLHILLEDTKEQIQGPEGVAMVTYLLGFADGQEVAYARQPDPGMSDRVPGYEGCTCTITCVLYFKSEKESHSEETAMESV
ncbi:hypothetical protein Z043_110982 [Scleropages formosus]|uniref:Uncharacterized protein n=1 Tax=Scleropages formosus TaxID=113540 RepID=A0A0P7UMW9_SCLFO|nr:hypothetical protein Z043_110982 [Scleropages formosus]